MRWAMSDGNNWLRCRLRSGRKGAVRRHLVKSRSQLEATTTADDARFELARMTTTSDAEPPCVECEEAKRTAAAKAAVAAASEAAAGDHLQLGECAPVYKAWAKCVEANAGQAKACAESLREFQKCHAQLFRGKR